MLCIRSVPRTCLETRLTPPLPRCVHQSRLRRGWCLPLEHRVPLQHDLGDLRFASDSGLFTVYPLFFETRKQIERASTRPQTVVSTRNKALAVVARGTIPERNSVHPTPRSAQRRRWIRADQWLAFSTTSRVHAVGRDFTIPG